MNLIKKISIYSLIIFLSRVSGLLLYPILYRKLPEKEIFLFEITSVFLILISVILSLQLNTALNRDYYSFSKNKLKKVVGSIISYNLIISILTILSTFFIIYFLSYENLSIFLYIVVLFFFQNTTAIFQTIIRFKDENILFFKITSIYLVLNVSICLFLIFYVSNKAEAIFLAQIFSNLFIYIIFFRKLKSFFIFNFSKKIIFSLVSYSYPAILSLFGAFLNQHFSKILIGYYFVQKDLILFSVAFKLCMIYLIAENTFKTVWQPKIIKNIKNFSEVYFVNLMEKYLTFFILLFLFLMSFSYPIIYVLFSHVYIDAIYIVPIALAVSFFEGLKNVINIGNQYSRKIIFNALATVVSGIFCLLAIFLMKNSLEIYGISVIIVISTFIQSQILFFSSQKNHFIKYNYLYFYFIILTVTTYCSISFFIKLNFEGIYFYLTTLILTFMFLVTLSLNAKFRENLVYMAKKLRLFNFLKISTRK